MFPFLVGRFSCGLLYHVGFENAVLDKAEWLVTRTQRLTEALTCAQPRPVFPTWSTDRDAIVTRRLAVVIACACLVARGGLPPVFIAGRVKSPVAHRRCPAVATAV